MTCGMCYFSFIKREIVQAVVEMGTHPAAHRVKNIPERTVTISDFTGKRTAWFSDVVNTHTQRNSETGIKTIKTSVLGQ